MSKTALALVAITAAGGLIAGPAFAVDAGERASIRVQYADLDLARDPGVNSLYARLRRAAADVCERPGSRDLKSRALEAQCRDQALDEAVARVHNPRLKARHAGVGHAIQLADARGH